MKKYVISDERWQFRNKLFSLNSFFRQTLRNNLVEKLEELFGKNSVDFIPEWFLRGWLKKVISARNCPVVSLERFYINTPFHMDICRAMDARLDAIIGLSARPGADNIKRQICRLTNFKEIILADDILFSGGVWEIIEKIRDTGIKVKELICGISIGEGKEKLQANGVKVTSILHYEEVIDEICHRDFYAGVPYSGRMIVDNAGNNIGSAPYFIPFGKPVEWASIPENKAEEFSIFCLRQSIKLWEHIEKRFGKAIMCSQVERLPLGAPDNNTRFVEYLASLL